MNPATHPPQQRLLLHNKMLCIPWELQSCIKWGRQGQAFATLQTSWRARIQAGRGEHRRQRAQAGVVTTVWGGGRGGGSGGGAEGVEFADGRGVTKEGREAGQI